VQRKVSCAQFLARWVEVEVERIDGIDLGKAGIANAPLDGAAKTTLFFLIGEAVRDVESGEIVFGSKPDERGQYLGHAWQAQPSQLLHEQIDRIVMGVGHGGDPSDGSRGTGPGSRVTAGETSWS
jgi:hypothetical protein